MKPALLASGTLALALIDRGDLAGAREILQSESDLASSVGDRRWHLARARLLLREGDPEGALATAEEVLPDLEGALDFYDVGPANQAGAFRAVPNPVPVQEARTTSFDAAWTGLEANARYLGVLEYAGALSPTFVSVTTTP